jgi:hypothetical protein
MDVHCASLNAGNTETKSIISRLEIFHFYSVCINVWTVAEIYYLLITHNRAQSTECSYLKFIIWSSGDQNSKIVFTVVQLLHAPFGLHEPESFSQQGGCNKQIQGSLCKNANMQRDHVFLVSNHITKFFLTEENVHCFRQKLVGFSASTNVVWIC